MSDGHDDGVMTLVGLVGRGKRVLALSPSAALLRHLDEWGCSVLAVRTASTPAMPGTDAGEGRGAMDSTAHSLAEQVGEERFDAVVVGALEALHDPPGVLSALQRYLHRGGYVVVAARNAAHLGSRLALLAGDLALGERPAPDQVTRRLYSLADLETVLDKAGLAAGQVERQRATAPAGDEEGHAVPRAVRELLAQEPEAGTVRFAAVCYPLREAAAGALMHRLGQAAGEIAAVGRGVAELRQALEEHAGRLDALGERLTALDVRQEQIGTTMLGAGHLSSSTGALLPLVQDLETRTAQERGRHAALRTADPHKYVEYQRVIHRIRGIVYTALPPNAVVVVVSKGDDDLLQLDGRQGWHFPQLPGGVYAGHYPGNSGQAIAHLEALRARGAEFLLFPHTALWWLDHYAEFRQHLETAYRAVVRQDDTCVIFALR
jgi:hypothetical protein